MLLNAIFISCFDASLLLYLDSQPKSKFFKIALDPAEA
jgi:hypothetical protein